jgi:hypothetical protein
MKFKQIIALPILGLALGNLAYAGQVPTINPINGFTVPKDIDYSFNNRGLNVSVASVAGGYQLTASGTGNFTFYGQTPASSYSGTTSGTGYLLTANFDSASNFVPTGSKLNIYGSLGTTPPGSSGTPSGLLYDANLTNFGYDASQAAIAFVTLFNPSWSNQPLFTGGSTGEVAYLFDQVGLTGGYGRLSGLTSALQAGNLAGVAGKTFRGVESIATVPLPLPVVLFGTGLTALMGLGRQRRNNAKSI